MTHGNGVFIFFIELFQRIRRHFSELNIDNKKVLERIQNILFRSIF